jgi:two-component system, NarL family, response regulator LiaR
MIITAVTGALMDSVAETTRLLANRRILVAVGNRLTLTSTVMAPPINQSLVGGATTEEEALELQLEHNPDILITSESLEKGYGVRLVERAKRHNPDITALIFIQRETHEVVEEAMEAGADGVMLVSSIGTGHGDFINALRTTSKGGIYFPQPVINACFANKKPAPTLAYPLTNRELEVIQCLVQGMKNAEIASELSISTETVKSHVSSTISKLQVRDRVQAVAFALNHGLITV